MTMNTFCFKMPMTIFGFRGHAHRDPWSLVQADPPCLKQPTIQSDFLLGNLRIAPAESDRFASADITRTARNLSARDCKGETPYKEFRLCNLMTRMLGFQRRAPIIEPMCCSAIFHAYVNRAAR